MNTFLRLFLALALPILALANPERWEKDIQKLTASDATAKVAPGAILFVGSSSIRMWTTLAEDFPGVRTINRGFGGATIPDVNRYISRIVLPYAPRQIVFYCGANDIAGGHSAERVLEDFQSFCQQVRAALPETRIDFIAISPNPARWSQIETIRKANSIVEGWIKTQPHMTYVDTFHTMLGEDGQPKPDIFLDDKLHMNRKGYVLWTNIVGPVLTKEP